MGIPFDFHTPVVERQQQGLYRHYPDALASPQGPEVVVNGQRFVNFCSNDYLGLANHPTVAAAFKRGVDEYGVGSGASHLVVGHSRAHQQLEAALAERLGYERVLLFSSGYLANLGVIDALLARGDVVYQDRLNHASLLDGGRLSAARMRRYPHTQCDVLERWLQAQTDGRALVVSDAVFSMDGDSAPLPLLATICQQQRALLMVDDAHGFGVLGPHGQGSVRSAGLTQQQVPLYMATLGKAVGVSGAFVAGSNDVIDYLLQYVRTHTYTTAMPPAVAVAAMSALSLIDQAGQQRQHLQHLIQRFQTGMRTLGYALMPSTTPIQPVPLGTVERSIEMAAALKRAGFLVSAIRPPTVPAGTARLRVTLSAAHSEAQVDQLLAAFERSRLELGQREQSRI